MNICNALEKAAQERAKEAAHAQAAAAAAAAAAAQHMWLKTSYTEWLNVYNKG